MYPKEKSAHKIPNPLSIIAEPQHSTPGSISCLPSLLHSWQLTVSPHPPSSILTMWCTWNITSAGEDQNLKCGFYWIAVASSHPMWNHPKSRVVCVLLIWIRTKQLEGAWMNTQSIPHVVSITLSAAVAILSSPCSISHQLWSSASAVPSKNAF